MSEAFVAFVRSEDKVLVMQRSDDIGDLPGAWDGVYGAGDPNDIDSVTSRITECTGIDPATLTFVRSGAPRVGCCPTATCILALRNASGRGDCFPCR